MRSTVNDVDLVSKPKKGGKKPSPGALAVAPRPTSGLRLRAAGDGTYELEVSSNLLPPPPKSFVSNYATATTIDGVVHLVFGLRVPGRDRLDRAVMIAIESEDVRTSIYRNNPQFVANLVDAAAQFGPIVEREYGESLLPAERLVFERATVMALGYARAEADVRLWRMVPVHGDLQSESLLAPVVTIFLSTHELARVITQLTRLVSP